jgi:hypothetical protein
MRSITARVGGALDDEELRELDRLCTKLRLGPASPDADTAP